MATNITDNNIELYRGDDISFNLTFTDPDNNDLPIDITNWVVFFTIKTNKTDTDAKAVLHKEFSNFVNPALGIAPIIVSHTETNSFLGGYYYDFQVKRQDGSILTITSGGITFLTDITRRIV
jgi:uncharacterized protein YfaT (DUF1175 family)